MKRFTRMAAAAAMAVVAGTPQAAVYITEWQYSPNLAALPEPSTYTLILAGLAAMLGVARRRAP